MSPEVFVEVVDCGGFEGGHAAGVKGGPFEQVGLVCFGRAMNEHIVEVDGVAVFGAAALEFDGLEGQIFDGVLGNADFLQGFEDVEGYALPLSLNPGECLAAVQFCGSGSGLGQGDGVGAVGCGGQDDAERRVAAGIVVGQSEGDAGVLGWLPGDGLAEVTPRMIGAVGKEGRAASIIDDPY